MNSVVNIAAYKFVALERLAERRSEMLALCRQLALKGSILLSPEGINMFLAGSRNSIDSLIVHLREDPCFTDLEVKESFSDYQPFSRMLVKLKNEIIAFGVDGIEPQRETSPRISPHDLKRWLDEGRPVTLLDVRNDFEVETGSFDGARPIGVDDFRSFPAAVRKLPDALKDQPVVTFCTGGIRCEKAGPLMQREGFREVYQLDGGILKYFEECGGDHYHGDCFVFDKRVALDSHLKESEKRLCYACQAVLTPEDCQSPKYEPGVSCPYCYQTAAEKMAALTASRNASIRQVTQPLPGSIAYENRRPIHVPSRLDGLPLLDFLREIHTYYDSQQWRLVCQAGELLVDDQPVGPDYRVQAGHRLIHVMPNTVEPDVNVNIAVLYEDDAIVVVDKPAPLPMHACGRFNRNTLGYFLELVYRPLRLRAAHRLDANTSGVVVFSKTRHIASRLQPQFERGEVGKCYLARVHGHPDADHLESTASISAEPRENGTRSIDVDGLPAHTAIQVLRRLPDYTTIVEVHPFTGRTHQIRVHLWDLGHPICGDSLYLPDDQIGSQHTIDIDDPPLRLHAKQIEFTHPTTGRPICFEAPAPAWATE